MVDGVGAQTGEEITYTGYIFFEREIESKWDSYGSSSLRFQALYPIPDISGRVF